MVPTFSEQVGAVKRGDAFLVGEISNELRIAIWNVLEGALNTRRGPPGWFQVARLAAAEILNFPVDEVPQADAMRWFKGQVLKGEWYAAYDLLQFAIERFPEVGENFRHKSREEFIRRTNEALERYRSGYRWVGGRLAPITNAEEIDAIESAGVTAASQGLDGARAHLAAATTLLSKKPDPDYRNSIKESISAVESVAKRISGERRAGLAPALRALDERTELHKALESGFAKLYGFTSDEEGIRHAILEQESVGFDEAKFMLVACSAFVNFLISKADAAGLLS